MSLSALMQLPVCFGLMVWPWKRPVSVHRSSLSSTCCFPPTLGTYQPWGGEQLTQLLIREQFRFSHVSPPPVELFNNIYMKERLLWLHEEAPWWPQVAEKWTYRCPCGVFTSDLMKVSWNVCTIFKNSLKCGSASMFAAFFTC